MTVKNFLFTACLLFPVLCLAQNGNTVASTKNFNFSFNSEKKTEKPFTQPTAYRFFPSELERLEIRIKLPWGLTFSKERYFRTNAPFKEKWIISPRPLQRGQSVELKNRWYFGGAITTDRVRDFRGPTEFKRRGFLVFFGKRL